MVGSVSCATGGVNDKFHPYAYGLTHQLFMGGMNNLEEGVNFDVINK